MPDPRVTCACSASGLTWHAEAGIATCGQEQGPRLIMCLPPGPGLGHSIFRHVHRVLAGLGRIALVEYPGHGQGAACRSRAELVSRIACLAAAHPGAVLVGHSWGADIAVDVAREWPPGGLVLISPPPQVDRPRAWTEGSASLRTAVRHGTNEEDWYRNYLLDYGIPHGLAGDRERARRLLDGVPTYQRPWRQLRRDGAGAALPERLRDVSARTRILAGSRDDLLDEHELRSVAHYPHVRVSILPGGHYLHLDAAAAVRHEVATLLAEIENQ